MDRNIKLGGNTMQEILP